MCDGGILAPKYDAIKLLTDSWKSSAVQVNWYSSRLHSIQSHHLNTDIKFETPEFQH